MSEFKEARDMIDNDNVTRTYTEGRYVCFVLNNGMVVKLDPNKAQVKECAA